MSVSAREGRDLFNDHIALSSGAEDRNPGCGPATGGRGSTPRPILSIAKHIDVIAYSRNFGRLAPDRTPSRARPGQ